MTSSGTDDEKDDRLPEHTDSDTPAGAATAEPRLTAATSRRTFIAGVAAGAVAAGVPTAFVARRTGDSVTDAAATSEAASPAVEVQPSPAPPATRTPSPTPTAPAPSPQLTPVQKRRAAVLEVRSRAALMAADMPWSDHVANGDERAEIGYAFSFTKGLPHHYTTGLVQRPADFERFVAAVEAGSPQDFVDTPLGPHDGFRTAPVDARVRGWESQSVGLGFDLIGPDMQTLTMPPAPAVGSDELTAEMAEVYAQAVLRDEPLAALAYDAELSDTADSMLAGLGQLRWFDESVRFPDLSAAERWRRRRSPDPQTAFRGPAPGESVGPYVSQLLLAGTGTADGGRTPADGLVKYGAQTIDQRVRRAAPVDFMTGWDEWFDVQNALAPSPSQIFDGPDRFITTGRDLATFVHSDALYQAYFTACLVLFGHGMPLDPGMPFTDDDYEDHQQGFVLFAPNHVLSLLGEVSMRALKTVKYQKFNVHRRLRPEELAGRVERADMLDIAELSKLAAALADSPLADAVQAANRDTSGAESMLLPMAYAEGSPMHPSYGAGHGTVAGACATIMKALFDHTQPFAPTGSPETAFVPTLDGSSLEVIPVVDRLGRPSALTVEGEINKLAANIAIGRSWAGVHYFSDYWESILLGEAIAIEILREHMVTTPTDFTLTIPTFDGWTLTLEP